MTKQVENTSVNDRLCDKKRFWRVWFSNEARELERVPYSVPEYDNVCADDIIIKNDHIIFVDGGFTMYGDYAKYDNIVAVYARGSYYKIEEIRMELLEEKENAV